MARLIHMQHYSMELVKTVSHRKHPVSHNKLVNLFYQKDKFNKKYNVNIDKATYCRFEGIQRIKTAMRLLILEVVYFLFEIKDLKMMIIMIVIYLIIDLILYHVKRTKFIKEVKAQY